MRFDTKYLPLWLQNMQQMDELLTACTLSIENEPSSLLVGFIKLSIIRVFISSYSKLSNSTSPFHNLFNFQIVVDAGYSKLHLYSCRQLFKIEVLNGGYIR